MKWVVRFCSSFVFIFILAIAQNARADTLDIIVDIVLNAIDPALIEAKPLVKCIASGNTVNGCNEQFIKDHLNNSAAKSMPSDPKITLIINVVNAAKDNEWIRILDLTNLDLMLDITCDLGMTGTGPVKDFVCKNPLFDKVKSKLSSVLREILVAISDKDWMKLVTLAGPSVACDIIPSDDPSSATVCTVLTKVIGDAVGNVGNTVSTTWDQIVDWTEDLQGQTLHMSSDEYYANYLRRLTHKRALESIINGRQGLGMDPDEWKLCVKYFDSHKQAKDTAKKTCEDLGQRLGSDSQALLELANSVPQSYFDGYLKSAMRDKVAEGFWTKDTDDYSSAISRIKPHQWGFGKLPSSDNPYFDDYIGCYAKMAKLLYGGNSFPVFPELVPDSLRDWACHQSAGTLFANALIKEKLRLDAVVVKKLSAEGCAVKKKSGMKSLVFECESIESYNICKEEFAGYRNSHCKLD